MTLSKTEENGTAWMTVADPMRGTAELELIREMLRLHPADTLADRPDEALIDAVEDNLSFRVQTALEIGDDPARICAQGLAYDRQDGRLYELGSILVAPEFRGFRLQAEMMRVMILHLNEQDISLFTQPDRHVFAVVAETNTASWKSIESVGFEQPPQDHHIWAAAGRSHEQMRAQAKRLYVFPPARLAEVREAVRHRAGNPTLPGPGSRTLSLRFGARLQHFGDPAFYEAEPASPTPLAIRGG